MIESQFDLSVNQIKENFPNPTACPTNAAPLPSDAYCVGGSFVLTFKGMDKPVGHERFPDEFTVADVLAEVNPYLRSDKDGEVATETAISFAVAIMEANDCGDFGEAYDLLDKALSYREDETCRRLASYAKNLMGA